VYLRVRERESVRASIHHVSMQASIMSLCKYPSSIYANTPLQNALEQEVRLLAENGLWQSWALALDTCPRPPAPSLPDIIVIIIIYDLLLLLLLVSSFLFLFLLLLLLLLLFLHQ
jgi:hypothetical protein